jgi:hypothetical protein
MWMYARTCTHPRVRAHARTHIHTHKYVIHIAFPRQTFANVLNVTLYVYCVLFEIVKLQNVPTDV